MPALSIRHPLLRSLTLLLCLHRLLESSFQVLAQSDDPGAASGVEPGDIGAGPEGSEGASASGSSQSMDLSDGATIAISVVASLVVILGVASAVLFFRAKKRQWTVREELRRSARRVTRAVKAVATPRTPKKMTFALAERKGNHHAGHSADPSGMADTRRSEPPPQKQLRPGLGLDLEKGLPESAVTLVNSVDPGRTSSNTSNVDKAKKPRPPKVDIPTSAFEMDSPRTPVWKKIFGR